MRAHTKTLRAQRGTAATKFELVTASLEISDEGSYQDHEVDREMQSVYAPLGRKEGVLYQRVENKLRQIMGAYVGDIRTERGLEDRP